jgi:hypothetical protein
MEKEVPFDAWEGNSAFFKRGERLPASASRKSQDSTIHSQPKHSFIIEGRNPVSRFN